MDAKTLLVGQKVWMQSGRHTRKGRIVNITDQYVEVEPYPLVENETRCLFRFHPSGLAYIGEGVVGRVQSPGTEYGPYILLETSVKTPVETKYSVGQEVCMRSGGYTRKGRVAEVTELYVEVEPYPLVENETECLIRFHHNGKAGSGWEGLGLWEYHGGGWLQSDPRTPDWELVDNHSAAG
jgi:hypothetical protein